MAKTVRVWVQTHKWHYGFEGKQTLLDEALREAGHNDAEWLEVELDEEG